MSYLEKGMQLLFKGKKESIIDPDDMRGPANGPASISAKREEAVRQIEELEAVKAYAWQIQNEHMWKAAVATQEELGLKVEEFDAILASVFGPHAGSSNFTNLRLPGMGPGKNTAVPGESGSQTGEAGSGRSTYPNDETGSMRYSTPNSRMGNAYFELPRGRGATTGPAMGSSQSGQYPRETYVTGGAGFSPPLLGGGSLGKSANNYTTFNVPTNSTLGFDHLNKEKDENPIGNFSPIKEYRRAEMERGGYTGSPSDEQLANTQMPYFEDEEKDSEEEAESKKREYEQDMASAAEWQNLGDAYSNAASGVMSQVDPRSVQYAGQTRSSADQLRSEAEKAYRNARSLISKHYNSPGI